MERTILWRSCGENKMLFRKKKDELHKGDVFLAKGIYLKQPVMENGNILLNCFLRSVIVFLLTFGSLGGFLSAFSISYNYILVITLYMGLAVFFSWLYTLPKFFYRDLGYIAFFTIYSNISFTPFLFICDISSIFLYNLLITTNSLNDYIIAQ